MGIGIGLISDNITTAIQLQDQIEIEQDIKNMLQDVFAPATMEQFDKSRSTYENKLITTNIANKLYTKYSNELSEEDLKRTAEVSVKYSDINTFDKDCYIADLWIYNEYGLEHYVRYKFMWNKDTEMIEDYILDVLE